MWLVVGGAAFAVVLAVFSPGTPIHERSKAARGVGKLLAAVLVVVLVVGLIWLNGHMK